MQQIAIDIGYSATKVKFNGKLYKIPSAIGFATDLGINYGEEEIVEYKGEKYFVGEAAVGTEAFTTTDINFKLNFDPVIIYHILRKLNLVQEAQNGNLKFYLTLALADWKFKDNYLENLKKFEVNSTPLSITDVVLMPQGAGAYMGYVKEKGSHPSSAAIVEIGYNTLNFMVYENGQPKRAHSKGFSGHGVSSILRPFTAILESTYNMPFSEAEAMKIFMNGKFIFNGKEQPEIAEKIQDLKKQFVKKLFNSILTSEKKILATSEVVILAGGGCYLLEGIKFADNAVFAKKPYEFANINDII
jgi:plasmid segregation protein ParM